jgi:hypothetical protein
MKLLDSISLNKLPWYFLDGGYPGTTHVLLLAKPED